MSDYNNNTSSEDRFLRENTIASYACRQLADWALAHFGDRTSSDAYRRLVHALAVTGEDVAIEKVYKDLNDQGYPYRSEAVMRMYERFRREAEKQVDTADTIAA